MFKAISNLVKDFLGIRPRVLSSEESAAQINMVFSQMAARQRARTPVQQCIAANALDTPAEAEARKARLRFLYEQNWRAMRDVQFEKYLSGVFVAQGYQVELTGKTRDQGVDLIIVKDGVRTAIQVKGYHNSVSNAAVQQAYSGMKHYRCDHCAVITNSRFTNSAVQLSKTTNCRLIDERRFEAFVMGGFEVTT